MALELDRVIARILHGLWGKSQVLRVSKISTCRDKSHLLLGQIVAGKSQRQINFGANQCSSTESIADRVMPALKPSFYKLDRSQDVFDWDPV